MNLSGSLTRQKEEELAVGDVASHVANMGRMVEEMESRMRRHAGLPTSPNLSSSLPRRWRTGCATRCSRSTLARRAAAGRRRSRNDDVTRGGAVETRQDEERRQRPLPVGRCRGQQEEGYARSGVRPRAPPSVGRPAALTHTPPAPHRARRRSWRRWASGMRTEEASSRRLSPPRSERCEVVRGGARASG